ncbi:VWA domain-containing protein [Thermomonas sp. HDW16]|uniref:vWA domain-containing protein n=1 Tax=Thermomonas sp. HDW16 TaxID=2714945 RepID=UPI00140B2FD2|nr:VWA domain-containing protein [Thermomonas sp. HDW16]QIL19909.1 VWA domain-containing protein [Thermomonas sp. HDW16]
MSALRDLLALDGFAWQWMLLAIPLPWFVHVLMPSRSGNQAALRVPWDERLHRIANAGALAAKPRGFPWLMFLAWCLLCIAAARPQQLGPAIAPPQVGRDLMLAVDLSASMGEEDMALGGRVVDRLTAAKAVLADFLDRRVGDRVGLVVFGERAYALTPLTLDRDSVREQLGSSVVGMAGRATAIGDAIALSTKRLQKQPVDQRVLILLTDGVNTAGTLDPQKAAQIARDNGVRIHAIAFGGDGGALSVFGFQLPMSGDAVDEAGLQRIATLTGGRFFRARDTDALAGIYAEIDKLEPIERQGRAVRPKVERYPLPLGWALAIGMLALLLRRRG